MIFLRQINPMILKALAVFMLVSSCQDVETYKRGSFELSFNRNTEQTGGNPLSEKSQAVFSVNAARITIGQSSPVTIDLGTQTSYSQNNLPLGSISIVVELLQNTSNNLVLYNSSKSVTILEDQTVSTNFNNWTVLNSNINITSSLNSQYSSGNSISINWSNTHPELPVSIDVVDNQGSVIKNLIADFVSSSYTWSTSADDVGTNLALKVTSSSATVTSTFFDIIEQNIAPVATSSSESMDEDTVKTFTLSATDQNSDNLTYAILGSPSNGSITNLSGNQVTYEPNNNFNGTDNFTWKANDGQLDSNTASVTITINNTNDAPEAQNINTQTEVNTTKTISLVATDIDNDNINFELVSNPSNGSLGSISGENIDYTPATDFIGTDTFTYKANDGTEDSNVASVTINVTEESDVTVTEPNGGETWTVGETYTIRWSNTLTGNIRIVLWQNGAQLDDIASDLPTGDVDYEWTIPAGVNPGTGFKVQVIDKANNNNDFSDGEFTIQAATTTITVISPNAGESLTADTNYSIQWNYQSVAPNSVNIWLYQNGMKLGGIAQNISFTGPYVWNVGQIDTSANLQTGSGFKVQICDSNTGDCDESDASFTIQSSSSDFTLTTPNGGETFTVGQTNSISWTGATEGGSDLINIWLYKDNTNPGPNGSGSLGAIINGFASSGSAGSFGWNATSLIGGQAVADGSTYRVQIHNQATGESDFSESDFSITGAGIVTVNSPNGGETLITNTSYTISWSPQSTNNDIELWQNGTKLGDLAIGIAPSSASFDWNVSNIQNGSFDPGSGFRIKVIDNVTGASDLSDGTFNINEGSTVNAQIYPDIQEGYDERFHDIIYDEISSQFSTIGISREKGDQGQGGTYGPSPLTLTVNDSDLSNTGTSYTRNMSGFDKLNSSWPDIWDGTGSAYQINNRGGNVANGHIFAFHFGLHFWIYDTGSNSILGNINIYDGGGFWDGEGVYSHFEDIGDILQVNDDSFYLSVRVDYDESTTSCEANPQGYPAIVKTDQNGNLLYYLNIDYEPDSSKYMFWEPGQILQGESANVFYFYGESRRCSFSNSEQIRMFRVIDTGTEFTLDGSYNLSALSGAPIELFGRGEKHVVQDVSSDMFRFILFTGGSNSGLSTWSINPQTDEVQYEGTNSGLFSSTANPFVMKGFGDDLYIAYGNSNINIRKISTNSMTTIWERNIDIGSQSEDVFGGMTTHNIGNGGVAISGMTRPGEGDEWDAFILLLDESGSRIE